jgi:phosphatidylcholine synthase
MKARAIDATALAETNGSRLFMLACAWGVHLYTALGAVFGVLAIHYAAVGDYRASFIAMAVTIAVDCSDGTFSSFINVKKRVPVFDFALLDNIVDYLTYVLAPVFLIIRAGLVTGTIGFAVAGFVLIASAYQFCQANAKTPDNFFLGFPSYWNLVVFYLYFLCWGLSANELILTLFGVMVFVPIKYIYPSRTKPLRPLTLTLGLIWGVITIAMLPSLPSINPVLLYLSLAYIAYYLIASFTLHARSIGAPQPS